MIRWTVCNRPARAAGRGASPKLYHIRFAGRKVCSGCPRGRSRIRCRDTARGGPRTRGAAGAGPRVPSYSAGVSAASSPSRANRSSRLLSPAAATNSSSARLSSFRAVSSRYCRPRGRLVPGAGWQQPRRRVAGTLGRGATARSRQRRHRAGTPGRVPGRRPVLAAGRARRVE